MMAVMPARERNGAGTVYEILVRSKLGDGLCDELGASRLEERNGRTLIVIEIVDQSHLHGTIERLRDLNVEIESVNPG
jgi:hypothetical protein